ncbi:MULTISPECIES: hypothetical protein [unclassified Caballeronia]|uniref:hypothetical protein n=1 Tax=unclassified Caballeronia TaxID=2646786 RepID=UPI0020297EBA|nr:MULTISPECIES: hypothetical protein [unclassified Caballeronia]MDR5797465.1 hypothetical protein [Caballeronia sp. LZ008]
MMYDDTTEDVSARVVPGSVGSAGAVFTPWAPRRTADFDRARSEALAQINRILNRDRASNRAGQSTTRRGRVIRPADYRNALHAFYDASGYLKYVKGSAR